MIQKAYGPQPKQFDIPDRFHHKLKRLTSQQWWDYTFAKKDLTTSEWLKLTISGLTGAQWVSLHGSCGGRPPYREAQVHVYRKLVCRGCGATLVWSDADEKQHPFRYEVHIR